MIILLKSSLLIESTGSNVGKKKGKNNKKGKGKGGADSAEVADTTAGEAEVATATEVAVEVSSEPASDGGSAVLVQQLETRLEEATQHCISIEQKHADQLVALEAQLEQVLSAERIASADSAALTARLESLSSEWAESQTKLAELTNQNVELDGDKARISMQLASVSEELVAERTRLSDELAVVSERLAVASSGAESSTQALLDELSMLKLRHDHLEVSHAALVAREAAVSEELPQPGRAVYPSRFDRAPETPGGNPARGSSGITAGPEPAEEFRVRERRRNNPPARGTNCHSKCWRFLFFSELRRDCCSKRTDPIFGIAAT
jgi:hypothetical protein